MAAPTSRIPVRLDLKRLSASGNATSSSLREAKTQPAFFKDVLGLRSGEPFDFNLERWRALGRCGLFRNLTARTMMGQDGVYLNITGFEVPSTSFAPEVTAVASLDNPEVLGGVTWKDSNFRGMGEYLSFSVMKKEGIEEGVQDLDPTIAVRWVDRTVGRDSQISFNFEKENLIESNINLVTNAVQRVYGSLAGGDSWVQRVPVQCTAVGVQLQSTSRAAGWLGRWVDSVTYRVEPFFRKYEQQMDVDTITDDSFKSDGAKNTISAELKSGITVGASYEGGFLRSYNDMAKSAFHQINADLVSPLFAQQLFKNQSAPEGGEGRKFFALQKFKMHGMRSWGGGCIPIHHHDSLSNPQVIRGYAGAEDTSFRHVSSFISAKLDMYISGLYPGLLGVWTDTGLYKNGIDQASGSTQSFKPITTAGVSIRTMGIRADFGRSVRLNSPIQMHLSFDMEGLDLM
ncbi:hypothetical protein B484DRAFT_444618 [Ochromonadaceae sp. CCMP2298]|nr:hypothetical protein B484DRAFT_444618 [Ochromonadaceae sp. CCMP2298]